VNALDTFTAPTEDILFSLERVAGAQWLDGWDEELAAEIVAQFARFAAAELAPLNAIGDAHGCTLVDGRVRMPPGFTAALRSWADQGWPGLTLPEAYGGQGLPAALGGAITEIFAGANHALEMLCGLASGAARALLAFGTDAQRHACLPRLARGEWLATMCLTEPGAGSDLARIRTTACERKGAWRIAGEKIFISGGDHDLGEGILHLVLARTGAPEEGVRGLSLFLCRSHDDQGERNAIRVARVEDKMGIHASPTCHLVFEDAHAELVGRPGEGLKAMFVMMNHSRIGVALQGVAHASRATQLAVRHAAERVQGILPGGRAPVAIEQHGDVRRMLQEQQALTVSARALCHVALVKLDQGGHGALLEFLTPLCKFYGSEAGIRAAGLGMQVLGGYGYLREYGLEQILRDARITSLYEGTNGIQAMTVAGRLLRHREGASAEAFADWVRAIAAGADGRGKAALDDTLRRWEEARTRVRASQDPGTPAHAFMQLSCCLAALAVWQRTGQACAADPDGSSAGLAELARQQFDDLPARADYWATRVVRQT